MRLSAVPFTRQASRTNKTSTSCHPSHLLTEPPLYPSLSLSQSLSSLSRDAEMDAITILPVGSVEKAICLPEVLTSIFSWLKDEKHTLRSARLVSKQFLATANQFFRIHLTADYAVEHNCIQEAAVIIGGLTLTFPRIITDESNILNRHLGLEPQDNVVNLDFCSMVARNCVHLETIKIVLEGPYSEEISQLLSCLFSQNPESAAVFRVKSLDFTFGFKFVESVVEDVRDHNLPDSCNGLLPATDYIPAESAFSRLEKMSLVRKFMVELPSMYRILQLKICPEVAAATSFLGPVCWNRMERAARLPTASLTAKPSRTFKTFKIPSTLFGVNELYALQEQAPGLEEVNALTICNTDESISNEVAFARDSARSPGTLHLKRLFLLTTMDQDTKLLLCRLFDTSVLESYISNFIYRKRAEGPLAGNNAEGFAQPARSNILNEILDEMREDPISGRPQGGFFREFGFNSCDMAVEHVNWLQRLKDTRRLHRLEKLSLPLTIDGFLDIFDTPVSLVSDSGSNIDPAVAVTSGTTVINTSTNVVEEKGPVTPLPFPACSSLLSFHIGGCDSRIIGKESGRRFANYLVRNLPRLKHLSIPKSTSTDYSFLDIIAPLTVQPLAPSSSSPPLPLASHISQRDSGPNDDGKRMPSQEGDSHSEYSHLGLYRLESLTISFNFMTRSEFSELPRSEHAMNLLKRRDAIFAQHTELRPGQEGYDDFQVNDKALEMEVQRMLLEARTPQCHEDQIEQFLAILDRFQRKKGGSWFSDDKHVKRNSANPTKGVGEDVAGLKQMTVSQSGMPKVYVEILKARVASQFPELDFKISSHGYRL